MTDTSSTRRVAIAVWAAACLAAITGITVTVLVDTPMPEPALVRILLYAAWGITLLTVPTSRIIRRMRVVWQPQRWCDG